MQPSWYVLITEPQRENTSVAGLSARGIEAYGPTVMMRKMRRGRKVEIVQPMFRGYVFTLLTEGLDDFGKPLLVNGIADYLKFMKDGARRPCRIPQLAIDKIREREEDEYDLFKAKLGHFKFAIGDVVRATEGLFAGFPAEVVRMNDKGNVDALVEMFGRKSKVTFEGEQLEKV